MFELKVREEEKDGFIYKIMNINFNNKEEEVYIKLPISEKELLTDMYDPYVVFNIYKMMSVGGDCIIRGKVSKSLLDNLEMFVNCWRIWLPNKCKEINIIADEEIDDEPKKLNNDAVMCFSGGLDSVSSLYRHSKGLSGRNNKKIKKLLSITGARDESCARGAYDITYKEIYAKKTKKMESIANDLGYNVIPVLTNLYETTTDFWWLEEFFAFYVSILMLYQDTYNNLIMASDQFINYKSISLKHRSNNPISNNFLQSNRFKLITDGQFLTRIDKMNSIKDWKFAVDNLLPCDASYTEKNMCCGNCHKCLFTKLDYKYSDIDVDLNKIYENPKINLDEYKIIGDNYIFYEEILYYDKYKKKILDYNTRLKIKYLIEENRNPKYIEKINRLKEELKSNWFNLLTIFNISLFSITSNYKYLKITILGIKIVIKKTRPDQTRPDQTNNSNM